MKYIHDDSKGWGVLYEEFNQRIKEQIAKAAEYPYCRNACGITVWRFNAGNVYSQRGSVRAFLKRWRLGKGKRIKMVHSTKPRASSAVRKPANENRKSVLAANGIGKVAKKREKTVSA